MRIPTVRLSTTLAFRREVPGDVEKDERLLQSQRPARPPDRTCRRIDERRHVPSDKVVRLGVPNRPGERCLGDLQVASRQPVAECFKPCAHVPGRQFLERPGADLPHERRQDLLVHGPGALGPSRQPALEPVIHRLLHGVGSRGAQATVELGVQRLEVVPDFLLVRPVTLRRLRFPSGPKPSETAPT